jgi:peptidoglycan-associated lipoprotein
MNIQKLTLVVLIGAVLTGCPKPPPPPPPPTEQAPPKVEAPKPAPEAVVEAPKVDEAAERRARIQARMAEIFKPIYFAYDQSTLSAEGKATAEAIARLLQEAPEVTVSIEGHADERGTNEYNLALGQRRAATALDYLSSLGVNRSRLKTISYGEERPFCTESNEACWQKNRRARFVITGTN